MSLLSLLLLVCVTTTRGAAKSDTPITCEARPCTAGTGTSVTCNFNENIIVNRHAFSVVWYPFNASRDDIGRPVLVCDWPESRTKPECYVKEGFSYSVNDRLTLEILNATEELAGQYACFLNPSGHRTVKECTLIVRVPEKEKREKDLHGQERKSSRTGTQTTGKEPVSQKAVSGEQSNSSTQTGTGNSQGGYADFSRVNFGLNVVILVLFVVVGIGVAVVLIRKRKRRLYGEKADEKQQKPNCSIDGKQQTTQSPHAYVEMEPTTPMLSGYPPRISPRCSDSGNSSDEPNDVSHA